MSFSLSLVQLRRIPYIYIYINVPCYERKAIDEGGKEEEEEEDGRRSTEGEGGRTEAGRNLKVILTSGGGEGHRKKGLTDRRIVTGSPAFDRGLKSLKSTV